MGASIGGSPITIDDCKMVEVIEKLLVDVHELKEKVKKLEWINEVEGACRNKEREQQESGPR